METMCAACRLESSESKWNKVQKWHGFYHCTGTTLEGNTMGEKVEDQLKGPPVGLTYVSRVNRN